MKSLNGAWGAVVLLLALGASVINAQLDGLRLNAAHIVPTFNGDDDFVQIFVEFNQSYNREVLNDQDDFICSDFFSIEGVDNLGNRSNLLPRANCRFCPVDGIDIVQNVGVILLPRIEALLDVIGRGNQEQPEFRQAKDLDISVSVLPQSRGEPVTVDLVRVPDAPRFQDSIIIDTNNLLFIFSAPVVIIRGQVFDQPFTTLCGNLGFIEGISGFEDCSVTFISELNAVKINIADRGFVDFFQFGGGQGQPETTVVEERNLQSGNMFVEISSETYFGDIERFGLKPVPFEFLLIDFPPFLDDAQFDENFKFTILFDQPMQQKNVARAECRDFLHYFIETEEFGVIDIFDLRDDLFCSIVWINSFEAEVAFTDIIPFLQTGNLDIPISSKFEEVESRLFKGANNISFAVPDFFGNGFVVVDEAIYTEGLDFEAIAPSQLTLCDTSFTVEVNQIAGAAIQTVIDFSIESAQNVQFSCTTDGNLFTCNILDNVEQFDGVLTYVVSFDIVPLLANNITADVSLFSSSVEVTQNVDAALIPVSIAGISGANPTRTVKRGVKSQFNGVLGSVFNCDAVAQNLESQPLKFTWTVTNIATSEVLTVPNTKTLALSGSKLFPGTYTAKFLVEPTNATTLPLDPNSAAFTLIITDADPVLVNRVGEEFAVDTSVEFILLDASRSCNPNVAVVGGCELGLGLLNTAGLQGLSDDEIRARAGFPSSQFSVLWSCANCGAFDPFQGLNAAQSIVKIPSSNFENFTFPPSRTQNFEFEYTITKLGVAGGDPTVFPPLRFTLELTEAEINCPIPVVTIKPIDGKVNVNDALTIFGKVDGFSTNPALSTIQTITWAIQDDAPVQNPALAQGSLNIQRENLFLPANILVEGFEYKMTLTALPKCPQGSIVTLGKASVKFRTNRRPAGGRLVVNPQNGNAINTQFALSTTNWNDLDGDFPLQFGFEIAFVNKNQVVSELSPQQVNVLRTFTSSPTFRTTLPLPPNNNVRMILLATARDAAGAVSRRLISNANQNVVVANPFIVIQNNVPVVDPETLQVNKLENLIKALIDTGDISEVPQLCTAITSGLNELSAAQAAGFEDDLVQVRTICFASVKDSLANADENEKSVGLVNSVAAAVASISNFDNVGENTNEDDIAALVSETELQVNELLQEARTQTENQLRGEDDPLKASILPDSFRENIVTAASNILSGSTFVGRSGSRRFRSLEQIHDSLGFTEEQRNHPREKLRRLADVPACETVDAAKGTVEALTDLQNSFVVAGAPQIDAKSKNILLATARENINEVGTEGKTNKLQVPFEAGKGANNVLIPESFAAQAAGLNPDASDNDLNMMAVKWNFPIRCEVRVIEEVDCFENYTYDGPREGSEGSVLSVEFIAFNQNKDKLVVENLPDPLELTLDAPVRIDVLGVAPECPEQLAASDLNDKVRKFEAIQSTVVTCGLFDVARGDFNTEFCEATQIVDENGIVQTKCLCNHASDFAAWEGFKYDVGKTFRDQLSLTRLSKLVYFTFFPIIALLSSVSMLWAYRRDQKDAKNLLKGSLARVKLLRIINRKKKQMFFNHYEEALLDRMAGNEDVHDGMDSFGRSALQVAQIYQRNKQIPWYKQYYLALKYEHSLFGLSRYDPNFSRVQRVAVFYAVVVANFGAAALIFEFRSDEYQISILLTVGVSFLAAFLVSIPIKTLVRILFKTTDNQIGSEQDMVNNMYRVLTRLEKADGVETDTDRKLVNGIHSFFRAQRAVQDISKRKNLSRKQSLAATKTKKNIRPVLSRVESIGDEGGDVLETHSQDSEALSVHEVDDHEEIDPDRIVSARELLRKAKENLTAATHSARSAWSQQQKDGLVSSTFYSSWSRIKSARTTSGGIAKFATLFADTPNPNGKSRRTCLPAGCMFFDWTVLILVVGFYIYYMILFVGTRAERSESPPEELLEVPFVPLTEKEYFVQWCLGAIGGILVSYLVAEPLIALFRYVMVPKYLAWRGKKEEEFDEIDFVDEKKKKENIREGYSHYGFDLAADLIENLL